MEPTQEPHGTEALLSAFLENIAGIGKYAGLIGESANNIRIIKVPYCSDLGRNETHHVKF